MSLDYHLEADKTLGLRDIEAALVSAGWKDIELAGNILTALAPGFSIHAELFEKPKSISSEIKKELSFSKYVHCYIRTRGPYPDDIFEKFLADLALISTAEFIVSFQFETILFWRDSSGLHKA